MKNRAQPDRVVQLLFLAVCWSVSVFETLYPISLCNILYRPTIPTGTERTEATMNRVDNPRSPLALQLFVSNILIHSTAVGNLSFCPIDFLLLSLSQRREFLKGGVRTMNHPG